MKLFAPTLILFNMACFGTMVVLKEPSVSSVFSQIPLRCLLLLKWTCPSFKSNILSSGEMLFPALRGPGVVSMCALSSSHVFQSILARSFLRSLHLWVYSPHICTHSMYWCWGQTQGHYCWGKASCCRGLLSLENLVPLSRPQCLLWSFALLPGHSLVAPSAPIYTLRSS